MSEITWFNFENKDLDFPFYKKNPYIPKWGWVVLFFALIIGYFFMIGSSMITALISMLIPLIPLLYFLKWDYKAIFQKPKSRDIALAVGLAVAYLIYALILDHFVFAGMGSDGSSPVTWMSIPPLFFSLMGEELLKFIPFMFFLRVLYKYSNNRKLSVIASMLIVMIFFASIHAFNLNMLVFVIFAQGLGSIFEFIGYIKTKNILISYITHLCSDVIIFSLTILGVA